LPVLAFFICFFVCFFICFFIGISIRFFIPFFILQIQQKPVNIDEYLIILRSVLSNHAIGKVLFQWNQAKGGEKVYILLSLAFYVFSIYQNILVCVRFYSNMKNEKKDFFLGTKYILLTCMKIIIATNLIKNIVFGPSIHLIWEHFNLPVFLNLAQKERAIREFSNSKRKFVFDFFSESNKIKKKEDIHSSIFLKKLEEKYENS
jgi:glucan phosphoethanolaminetransferase (alkaline phosphatase superfamily)